MKSAVLRLGLLVLMLAASALAIRPGDFRVIGPGGGGAMFHPTVSPHDANTVLIACDMTGAYITHDGGQSWRMFNLRGDVRFFVFDPIDSHTIYAKATGLWRSTDNGESWNLVYPAPSAVKGIQRNSDHSDENIVADPDPLKDISAMAIDPASSQILYAAAGTKENATLFVSADAGATWHLETRLPELPSHIWIDPQSTAVSRILYIGGPHGIVKRTPSETKNPTSQDVPFNDITMGFGATGPVAYATSQQGVFVSKDAGATWQQASFPGTGAEVRAVGTSLHQPETAYVSYGNLQLDGKSWLGVAKTTDSGATWKLLWKESDKPGDNIHDAWISERLGVGWAENPLNLEVADQDANLAYGTDLGRTMKTSDGGATWNAVYSRRVPGAGWTSTGLDVTTVYGIHFDPFDAKRQFLTYTDIGLFRSEDGGASWVSSTDGVPQEWRNTTYWVVFDPKMRGRMWSVNSYTHDLPRPKMWRTRSTSKFKGGVCRSDDGGNTWTKSNTGMVETAATHIILDPESPVKARVLYVAAFGRGVYKSVDGGDTWTLKNKGITQSDPMAWRLVRDAKGTLYLLIARRSEDGSIGNSGDGAIYRSTDGAETWQSMAMPAGANAPNGLAVDDASPNRLYLATWARAVGMHGEGGGVYLSEDGGKNWLQILSADQHVYDVTIDPKNPDTIYAAGFESSAWRSTDRGDHWTRIPGFNFKWGYRVIPDPLDTDKIYIPTFGGSVWHGSINGVSRPQDIATPKLLPGRLD